MKHVFLPACFLYIITAATVLGQSPKLIRHQEEVRSLIATTGELPFWMRANQYGIVPRGQTSFSLRSAWRLDYRQPPRTATDSLWERVHKTDWGWGIDAVANVGSVNEFVLPEAYIKARVGIVEFSAGRRREVFGLGGGSPLSTGSYAWSGNALPVVKLQAAIPDFWPRNSALSIKGSFAQGWFNDGFVQGSWLHQKSVYIRIGKPSSRLKAYGGFNHQVQWGGQTTRLTNTFIQGNQFPSSLQDYWWVITGASLNEKTNIDTTTYSDFDSGNRVGNHLGTVDLGIELTVGRASVLLYRQSVYEDGSLYYLTNIADGLNGVRIRNTRTKPTLGFRLTEVTLEFLNTFSQGGAEFVDGDSQRRGRDNYFNHGQFRDGWTYRGRTIGTPFIAPQSDLRGDLPQYTFYNNNRVRVFHAGLSGQVSDGLSFMVKASYSKNAGTYQEPFATLVEQHSAIATVSMRLTRKGLRLNGSAAIDRGELYTSNTGFSLGVSKSGTL